MMSNVVYDLRIFLMFYAIMIFLFSQIYSVMGMSNAKIINYKEREN